MGKSIKINDLINRMINLSGLTIKDDKNPKGDIEIKIIGLRPGEKIYEELLIGDKPEETFHPKIKKTQEYFIPYEKLKLDLSNLKILLDENKAEDVKELLNKILKLYNSSSKIVDHIHLEKMSSKDYDENVSQ